MIILRVAVPAVLAAAAVAGWFAYFVASPARVAPDPQLPPPLPDLAGHDTRVSTDIDQPPGAEEKAAQAYRQAAEAILRRAPNARASVSADEQPITGPIPLPKRRPVIAPDALEIHPLERHRREAGQEGEDPMKESTQAKITAAVAAARGMAQKALAASPNPEWTEYEMQSIDEWIALQDVKLDRPEAIRRLVELGLKAKGK